MTNHAKAKKIKNKITIKSNKIFLNKIQMSGHIINVFFGQQCNLSDHHKVIILSYFLKSKDLNSHYSKKTNKLKISFKKSLPLFNPVNVQHDPDKDSFFLVYHNFDSLLNLQAHSFKHCIVDHWKNQGLKKPDILDKDNSFFEDFWNRFKEIKCNFFSGISLTNIDTPERAKSVFDRCRNKSVSESIEKMKQCRNNKGKNKGSIKLEKLKELKVLSDSISTKNWCQECIKEHDGPQTFLKCWKLFSEYNIHKLYLQKIQTLIKNTIQDKANINLYNGTSSTGTPKRYHIHYRKHGDLYIASYSIENKNGSNHIYYLLLKKYKNNNYHLQTMFPKQISTSPEGYIHSQARKKFRHEQISDCCYNSNWKLEGC